MHVDTDEANAFSGDDNPYGVIVKLFDDDNYDLLMWMDELESGIFR
jgi:putative phosphotransacetylase